MEVKQTVLDASTLKNTNTLLENQDMGEINKSEKEKNKELSDEFSIALENYMREAKAKVKIKEDKAKARVLKARAKRKKNKRNKKTHR